MKPQTGTKVTNPRRKGCLRIFGAFALLLAIAVIASQWQGTRAGASQTVIVKMLDTPPSFDAKTLTVSVGTTVEWQNVGNTVHHATDDRQTAINGNDVASPQGAPVFDSGFLRPGETFTHTFTKPGVYKYVCAVHETSGMIGEVVVR
jgi:plastocyanin